MDDTLEHGLHGERGSMNNRADSLMYSQTFHPVYHLARPVPLLSDAVLFTLFLFRLVSLHNEPVLHCSLLLGVDGPRPNKFFFFGTLEQYAPRFDARVRDVAFALHKHTYTLSLLRSECYLSFLFLLVMLLK